MDTPGGQLDESAAPPCAAVSTWRWILGLAALAALVRLIPAALAFGTSDVMTWELLGRMLLDGENFYATQLHNWPALWIYFCAAAVLVHDSTGLPFSLLIKLPPIIADAAITALLFRTCAGVPYPLNGRISRIFRGMQWPTNVGVAAALAYALNPVAILITGYHGQFDALVLAPTLLAVVLLQRGSIAASALALGVGVWFKPVPLVLLPVLLPHLKTWRARGFYCLLAVAPAALGTLPYFVQWPADVAANFLGYSSWFGQWGYAVLWMVVEYVTSGTVPWWLPDPEHLSAPLHAMYVGGKFVLIGALAVTWWLAYLRRMDLLRGITATFAVFYFATSGFGVQYLLWILPFGIARRDRWLTPFTVAATLLLLVAYSLGRAYLPLAQVPDNGPSLREFVVKVATLPAWIVCGLWAWSLLRQAPTAR